MATISLVLQIVNGDPASSGGNINIATATTPAATFSEGSGTVSLSLVSSSDTVTIGSDTYTYDYLGTGDVRDDADQPAAFIRITGAPAGAGYAPGDTFAMDLNGTPGDPNYPNLQKGNTKLQIDDLDATSDIGFPGTTDPVPCFVKGTAIHTPSGNRLIEDLCVGDWVSTRDNGPQKIRWIGGRTVLAQGDTAPIHFEIGAIGNTQPFAVSPLHCVAIQGPSAVRLTGCKEFLLPAKCLVDHKQVWIRRGGTVTYFHMLFDDHQLVLTNGVYTESFYPTQFALSQLRRDQYDEITSIFPEMRDVDYVVGQPALPIPSSDVMQAVWHARDARYR